MSLKLKDNIDKIQKQLDVLEERFNLYLTSHTGEHTELTRTLQELRKEIKQLQDEMKRPQSQPPPIRPNSQSTREVPSRPPPPSIPERPIVQNNGRRNREQQPPVPVAPPRSDGITIGPDGTPTLDFNLRMQSIQAKAGTLMLHLLAHEALDIKTDKSFPGYQQKYKSMKSSYHVDTSPLYEFNS